MVAIALDGGMMFDRRRSCHAAADAAALAAAEDLHYNWQANSAPATRTNTSFGRPWAKAF
jgi:uncharacterized membrane protein